MVELRVGMALLLLAVVAVWDLRCRLIPNWVVVGLALLFLVPALVAGQWLSVLGGSAVAAVVFLIGVVLFHFGLIGGGDVKLTAALALWAGPAGVLKFLLLTSLAGGGVSLLCLAWAGAEAWRRGDGFSRDAVQVPYGIAIALGGLPAVLAPWAGS